MKKITFISILIFVAGLFISCASIPSTKTSEEIQDYYAVSDEECNFIFEFYNLSKKPLNIVNYIAETKKMNNQYNPTITGDDITVNAGDCVVLKFNADRLLRKYSNSYSVGINCYEKNWHWGYTVEKNMKYKRVRVAVTNDYFEGADLLYPPFKSENKFVVKESPMEYDERVYFAYQLSDTPEKGNAFYNTRVYFATSNGKSANLFARRCKDIIEAMLNNGEYTVQNFNGYNYLVLNTDPLDMNNYLLQEDYDFVYEIINNTSGLISLANILTDEETKAICWTSDIELEPGKSIQFKYDLKTLQSVYGYNVQLGCDVKISTYEKWIRGWLNTLDCYNQKHTIMLSDGTEDRLIDSYDLWSELLKLPSQQ